MSSVTISCPGSTIYYASNTTQRLQAWLNGQSFAPNTVWGWGIETPLDRWWWARVSRLYDETFMMRVEHEVIDVAGIPLQASYHERGRDSFLPPQQGLWFGRADGEWSVLIGRQAVFSKEISDVALYNEIVGVETNNLQAFERDMLVLMIAMA